MSKVAMGLIFRCSKTIKVPILLKFRRCGSRHITIHYKGGAIIKPGGNKGRPNSLKAGSETITECATIKDVIKSMLKPTINADLNAKVKQIVFKLIVMRNN